MPQVLQFLRRVQSTDWNTDELAELYRIENALVQARLSVVTDRGLSDEGDPWFAFCRTDGEVLVHIARFDGEYCLYASGLPTPLSGRHFRDLSKAFVAQVPLQVPMARGPGPQLFLHPSAILAIVIGTLIVAHDDFYFVSERNDEVAQVEEPRASLQALFQKHLAAFGGPVGESSNHESSYLNIIAAIGAVIAGTIAVQTQDRSTELLAAAPDASEAAAVEQAPQTAEVAPGWAEELRDGIQFSGTHVDQRVGEIISDDVLPPVIVTTPHFVAEYAAAQQDGEGSAPVADVQSLGKLSDEIVELAAHDDSLRRIDRAEGSVSSASSTATGGPVPHAEAPARSTDAGTGSLSVEAVSLIDQLLQHVRPAVVPLSDDSLVEFKVSARPTESAASAQPDTLFPLFDQRAQEILVRFLRDNPGSEVIFDSQNVIVYDGLRDPYGEHAMTVQVWQFDDGATIALVGHADVPSHAYGLV